MLLEKNISPLHLMQKPMLHMRIDFCRNIFMSEESRINVESLYSQCTFIDLTFSRVVELF